MLAGASLFCMAGAASAADEFEITETTILPAISAVNGKLDIGYVHANVDDTFGNVDDINGGFVQGALSVPLSQRFGLQIDAGVQESSLGLGDGSNENLTAYGIGGHLFWRDPRFAMLGFFGSYVRYDADIAQLDQVRLLAEGEYYYKNFTLSGTAGVDLVSTDLPFGDNEEFFTGSADLAYYFTDNIMAEIGVQHSFEETKFTVGFEALWERGGVSPSFYANAGFSDDNTTVMAGLRIYFAEQGKSLIRRHREDDPETDLFGATGLAIGCLSNAGGPLEAPRIIKDPYYKDMYRKPPPDSGLSSSLDGPQAAVLTVDGPPRRVGPLPRAPLQSGGKCSGDSDPGIFVGDFRNDFVVIGSPDASGG